LDKALEDLVNYIIEQDKINKKKFVQEYLKPVEFDIGTAHNLMKLFSHDEKTGYSYAKRDETLIKQIQYSSLIKTKYKDLVYLVIEYLLFKLPDYQVFLLPLVQHISTITFIEEFRRFVFRNKYFEEQQENVLNFRFVTISLQNILSKIKTRIMELSDTMVLFENVKMEYLKERKRRIFPFLKGNTIHLRKESYSKILKIAIKEKIQGEEKLLKSFSGRPVVNLDILEKDLHMALNAIYVKENRIGSYTDFFVDKRLEEKMKIIGTSVITL